MSFDLHTNFAITAVATPPSPANSGTTLVVTAGQGVLLPAAPFNMTVWPTGVNPLFNNAEIIRVTAKSTDTLTIVRAQEGSTARSIVVGDQLAASITAKTLTDIEYAATWDIGGPTVAAGIHIQGAGAFDVDGGGVGALIWAQADNGTGPYALALGNVLAGLAVTTGMYVRDDGGFELDAADGDSAMVYDLPTRTWSFDAAFKLDADVTLPFVMKKNTQAATAPGAGYACLRWEAGTNSGTAKLVAYAGTSSTGVTLLDNVGAGF